MVCLAKITSIVVVDCNVVFSALLSLRMYSMLRFFDSLVFSPNRLCFVRRDVLRLCCQRLPDSLAQPCGWRQGSQRRRRASGERRRPAANRWRSALMRASSARSDADRRSPAPVPVSRRAPMSASATATIAARRRRTIASASHRASRHAGFTAWRRTGSVSRSAAAAPVGASEAANQPVRRWRAASKQAPSQT